MRPSEGAAAEAPGLFHIMLTLVAFSSNESIFGILFCVYKTKDRLPWWRSGQESACRCREHRFEPWSGKIPRAAEQLRPCSTTTKPACHNY